MAGDCKKTNSIHRERYLKTRFPSPAKTKWELYFEEENLCWLIPDVRELLWNERVLDARETPGTSPPSFDPYFCHALPPPHHHLLPLLLLILLLLFPSVPPTCERRLDAEATPGSCLLSSLARQLFSALDNFWSRQLRPSSGPSCFLPLELTKQLHLGAQRNKHVKSGTLSISLIKVS